MMALQVKMLSELLAALSAAVASGDNEIIAHLYKALESSRQKTPKKQTGRRSPPESDLKQNSLFDENEVVRIFSSFPDREALEKYLIQRDLKKIDLIYIAKLLKVAIYKTDDSLTIIDKIIDATLGYKIRSQTIRGK